MTAAELAERLDGKRSGAGWKAKCPAHDDRTPSLTIDDGDKGVVFRCHGPCTQEDVEDALRLRVPELFARTTAKPASRPPKRAAPPLTEAQVAAMAKALRDNETAQAYLRRRGYASEVVAAHRLGYLERWGRPNLAFPYFHRGVPTFANCRRIDGVDEDKCRRFPTDQATTLYLGDSLEDGGTAILTEGEGDAIALLTLGVAAELGGAGGCAVVAIPGVDHDKVAVRELAKQQRVYLWTDNDSRGDECAERIAAALPAGTCRRVRADGYKDAGEILEQLGAEKARDVALERLRAAKTMDAAPLVQLLSTAEIFEPLAPPRWMCELLDVAPGAPLLVSGYGFSGKTVSLQDLALAVALGELAWGRFPVRAGRVLHLDYEQGSYLTRRRYQRLARARGVGAEDLRDRLTLAVMPQIYLDSVAEDDLARLCESYDLLIVDSFRASCPRTDENSSEARVPLDLLTRVSECTGVTPVVIHHARKPSRDAQGGARMAIRGSGALYDACGSALIFAAEKNEPIAVVHDKARITGRTHADFHLVVEDVAIDGDPTGGLRVVTADAPAARQQPAERFAELKARVLAFVADHGAIAGGVNTIRLHLGVRKEDVTSAVAELVQQRALVKGGTHRAPIYSIPGNRSLL